MSRRNHKKHRNPTFGGNSSTARPLLSLAMIARNEEGVIARAIESVRPVVDEVVVVDTGSTDRTREVAREHGARVFDYKWNHHFGEARTASLRHARGNYVFWMDADETVMAEDLPHLRALAEAGTYDLAMDISYIDRSYQLPEYRVEGLGEMAILHKPRLFRNLPGLNYRYRVHEAIHMPMTEPKICRSKIRFVHHGRMRKSKIDYYEALLLLDWYDDKADPHAAVYLAGRMLQNGYPEATLELLDGVDLARATAKHQIERFWFYRGRAYVMLAEPEEDPGRRRQFYQQALEAYAEAHTPLARLMAAITLVDTGNIPQALEILERSHQQDPDHLSLREVWDLVFAYQDDPSLRRRLSEYFQILVKGREDAQQEAPGQPPGAPRIEEELPLQSAAPNTAAGALEAPELVPMSPADPVASALARRPELNGLRRGLIAPDFKRGVAAP